MQKQLCRRKERSGYGLLIVKDESTGYVVFEIVIESVLTLVLNFHSEVLFL